jgi:hypothetical protein
MLLLAALAVSAVAPVAAQESATATPADENRTVDPSWLPPGAATPSPTPTPTASLTPASSPTPTSTPAATATDARTTTVTSTANASDGAVSRENVSLKLSPTATITEWRYQGGTWLITVEARTPTRLTITDAASVARVLSEGSGPASGTARYEGRNVATGTRTVRFTAGEYQGMAAVTISAARGNRLAVLRTDNLGDDKPSVAWRTAQGLILGTAIVVGGGTVYWTKRKQNEENEGAERIL